MKKLILAFFLLCAPGLLIACDCGYTNMAVVAYCIDCGDMCVPSESNSCSDVSWDQVSGYKSNWGYIQGDGDQSCQETVTFSNSFSSIPDVTINFAGYKVNSAPANRGDASVIAGTFATAQSLATNQFTVVVSSTANIATNVYVLYTWIAKPQGTD